ncbi:hypothetical protein [Actinomadura madurae]|uniref:hypothetical protein n=1 Tax=Actinomadura madurae TaxID=1993 RepID=UPI0020D25AAD|nr:hypothetical protein [Actinomadura madurae]MCP9968192.1 hypothetical protein [Actinomadura madurae]MCP9980649.1 hypothetical protein [Actinomadura madurae]MCQ0016848.1 hypothetical protein [Actinomadura madurae]
MSFTKAMGEVVRLPVPHPDHTTDPTDVDAPATAPGNAGRRCPADRPAYVRPVRRRRGQRARQGARGRRRRCS